MTGSIGLMTRGASVVALVGVLALAGSTTPAVAGHRPTSRTSSGSVALARVEAAPGSAVPSGFRASSITWISATRGWVLGNAPCAGVASAGSVLPRSAQCTSVIATTNGGGTWSLRGSLKAPIVTIGQSGEQGVSEIRFATAEVGWVFGPDLYRTTNGGRSWTLLSIPGGLPQVSDLAANSTTVYALVSPCKWASSGPCDARSYTFWRTKLTGSAWTRIPLALGPPKGMDDWDSDVALYGKTVYVLRAVATPEWTAIQDRLYVSTDGIHFSARRDPCDTAELVGLLQAVPTSGTDVTLLCEGFPSVGSSAKDVYRSKNTGKTDTFAGAPLGSGIGAELAASTAGYLAVSAFSGASFIYINDRLKTVWTQALEKEDGGLGWDDIVYVSAKEAWIVYAPAEDIDPGAPGQLFVTRDGGRAWSLVKM